MTKLDQSINGALNFEWHDGGRIATGFSGYASDCVTRAIAIALGKPYREIYDELFVEHDRSPRDGISSEVASEYLERLGFVRINLFSWSTLPPGPLVVRCRSWRKSHLTAVVDHCIYDTWNPSVDAALEIDEVWRSPATELCLDVQRQQQSEEVEKVLKRLRAIDRTAQDSASTEGERHSALRAMQSIMERYSLSKADLLEGIEPTKFACLSCELNGSRTCSWESSLGFYLATNVFPIGNFSETGGAGRHATVHFYGALQDVRDALELYRELHATITSQAIEQFGGYAKGRGASYAEGFVAGLPTMKIPTESRSRELSLYNRELSDWLKLETGISIVRTTSYGRLHTCDSAKNLGKEHGSKQSVSRSKTLRIEQK